MKQPPGFRPGRILAVTLFSLMIAACSTTQKSSTDTGSQEPAPISEATKAPPVTTAPSTSGAAPAQATPSEAAPDNNAAASGDAAETRALAGDEEAARLKQLLAEQEAEINRVRDEQAAANRLAEEEAAKRQALEASAAKEESPPVTSSPAAPDSQAASGVAASTAAAASATTAEPASGDAAQSISEQSDIAQPLQRSIYFDYDASSIDDEYDEVLIAHGAYLNKHPDVKVEIQGNCDERGSREYNLALGARRAESVKRALELAGAEGGRIHTVSFGSEKPVAFGQDEESYRLNRRVDILY